jgi:hypothetical protein
MFFYTLLLTKVPVNELPIRCTQVIDKICGWEWGCYC